MSSSVEVSVKLGLDKLRADAAKAAAELQQKFQDQTIEVNLAVAGGEQAQKLIASLAKDVLQAQAALSGDKGQALQLQKEAALLQEALRYKEQIAAIDNAFVDPQDIEQAKRLAAELNKLNTEQIEKGFQAPKGGFLGDLANHAKGFQDAVSEASQYTQALGQVSQQLNSAGDALNQYSNQAAAAAVAFDSAKAKVATLSKESEQFAIQMKALAIELNNQVTSTELLNASYDVLSSGFSDAADVAGILKASVLGAKGGFSDVGTVADATTTILNAFKLKASDAAMVVDILAQTQDKGKITIDQYAAGIGQAASLAANAGVKFKEFSAAVATATAKGVPASSAISGTRQAIVNLLKPTADGQKLLEKFGVTNAAAALKTIGLVGILKKLKEGGAKSEELAKIFSDVDAFSTVAALAGDNIKDFIANINAMDNANGKAAKSAAEVAKSFDGQYTQALNKANEGLIALGNGAKKASLPLLQALSFLVENFQKLPEPVREATGVLIALSGGTLTLSAALAAIAAVTPSVIAGFKALGIASALSGGATGANTIAMVANKLATLANLPATVALTGAKTGLTAATVLGTNALVGATAASKSFLVGVLPLLPALAALAAAVGVVALVKLTADLQNGEQALEDVQNRVNGSADAMFAAAGRTKAAVEALNEAKKSGTQVSAKQLEADKRLIAANEERLKQLDATLQAAEAAKVADGIPMNDADEAQANAKAALVTQIKSQITALQGQNTKLKEAVGVTGESTAAVEDQTKALEKQKNAIAAVGDTFSEQSKVQEAANKLRQTEIQTSVNQGLITEEEGRKQNLAAEQQYLDQQLALNEAQLLKLKDLRASTTDPEALKELNSKITDLESEAQGKRLAIAQKAGEARKAAETEALDAVATANEAANAKIEQSQNARVAAIKQAQVAGTISAEEAAKRIAQIESDSGAQVLAQKQAELEQVKQLRAAGTLSVEEAAKREAAIGAEISALNLSRLDKEIAAQKAAQDAAVQAVEESLAKRTAALNLSDAEQLAAIRERQGAGVGAAKAADAAIAQIEQARSQKIVQLKTDELAQVRALIESGVLSAEDGAQREIAIETELANLRQQAAEAELARTEQIKQAELTRLAAVSEAIQRNNEISQGQIGLETDAIARQNDLLSAKSTLLQAQSTLTEQRLRFAIEDAEAAGNSGRAEALKVQLAREQIAAKEQQLRIEQEQLALKQQQIALELESKQILADIAVGEADIAVAEARANGESAEKIANLQRIKELRVQQLDAVGRQITSQQRLNALEQQALNTQQQATREAAARALAVASRPPATAGSEGGGGRSNSTPATVTSATVTPATVTPATVTVSGGSGGTPATRSFMGGQAVDTSRLQTLSTRGIGDSPKGGALPRSPGLSGAGMGFNDKVAGKLDQVVTALKDSVGRPNVNISNVDDAATIGKIYRESGRDSARRAGL